MSQSGEAACPWCTTPKGLNGGWKMAFTADQLCPEHLAMSGIPRFEASHPLVDGRRSCTPTCGCTPFEHLWVQDAAALEPATADERRGQDDGEGGE